MVGILPSHYALTVCQPPPPSRPVKGIRTQKLLPVSVQKNAPFKDGEENPFFLFRERRGEGPGRGVGWSYSGKSWLVEEVWRLSFSSVFNSLRRGERKEGREEARKKRETKLKSIKRLNTSKRNHFLKFDFARRKNTTTNSEIPTCLKAAGITNIKGEIPNRERLGHITGT